MDDKSMYIPNYDEQNYPFCRLKLLVEMFEHWQDFKFYSQWMRERFYKTLDTIIIYSPLSPPCMIEPIFILLCYLNQEYGDRSVGNKFIFLQWFKESCCSIWTKNTGIGQWAINLFSSHNSMPPMCILDYTY